MEQRTSNDGGSAEQGTSKVGLDLPTPLGPVELRPSMELLSEQLMLEVAGRLEDALSLSILTQVSGQWRRVCDGEVVGADPWLGAGCLVSYEFFVMDESHGVGRDGRRPAFFRMIAHGTRSAESFTAEDHEVPLWKLDDPVDERSFQCAGAVSSVSMPDVDPRGAAAADGGATAALRRMLAEVQKGAPKGDKTEVTLVVDSTRHATRPRHSDEPDLHTKVDLK